MLLGKNRFGSVDFILYYSKLLNNLSTRTFVQTNFAQYENKFGIIK